jgi:single-strand DNA-binding protein
MVTSLTYITKSMYWQSPNHVVLGGNLTFDPTIREVKGAEGSSKVIDFSIANNLKSSGSPAGKAHFFKCEAWGKTAELIHEYFKKGDSITVVGALQWSSWEDSKTNEKRESVKVRVESFYFSGGQGKKSSEERGTVAPVKRPPPLPKDGRVQLYQSPEGSAPQDDEIPF